MPPVGLLQIEILSVKLKRRGREKADWDYTCTLRSSIHFRSNRLAVVYYVQIYNCSYTAMLVRPKQDTTLLYVSCLTERRVAK